MRSIKRLGVLNNHINGKPRESFPCTVSADDRPCVSVAPSVGMVDEKVNIHIRGLAAGQVVTVVAEVVENGSKFESCCVYIADSKGEIDNFTTESIGGYFKGIKAWKHGAKILVIVGEDDKQCDPVIQTHFYDLCPTEFNHLIEIHRYPGAGHLIEQPFSLHARATNPGRKRMSTSNVVPKQFLDKAMMSGGWTVPHAHAQEDSWSKILNFLDKNLKQR